MKYNKIRVGIAGWGYSAKTLHMPFIICDPRFKLCKIYSRNCTQDENVPFDTVFVNEFSEILTEEIELVIICTPNNLHYQMAKQALEANKNVVVEKPFAVRSEDARELCLLAEQKELFITAYQNRRFDGDFKTVASILNEGLLGRVVDYECHYDRFVTGRHLKQWKNQKEYGVNILYDLGVHLIDQAYVLFGSPNEVYADFQKQRSETPCFDRFTLNLYYDGLKVILSAGEVVYHSGFHFMIHGTEGSFIKSGMDVQEQNLKKRRLPIDKTWGEDAPRLYGKMYLSSGEERIVKTQRGNYGEFYDNVYEVIRNRAGTNICPNEIIDVLRIIELAKESNQKKTRMRMKPS